MRYRRHLDEDALTKLRRSFAGVFLLCGLLSAVASCSRSDGSESGADAEPGEASSPVAATAFATADSIVAEWVASERIAGAVLSVSDGRGRPLERAHGFARLYEYGGGQYPEGTGPTRLAEPEPMTTATLFDLASVTKVMATTMAVMLLADRGAIDVDASVSTYLPDFTGQGRESITVSDLLTHRSGLPQWLPTYYHAGDAASAWAYVRSRPLQWPVGEERHYSDLGFMTLGRLVASASGRGLDDFVRDEVYTPLGLSRTGFLPRDREGTADGPFAATSHGNPFERRMVHDPDFGYRIEGDPETWDGWRRYTFLGEVNDGNAHHGFEGVAGHAGLFAPAGELQAVLRLLLNEGEGPDGSRFVEAETVRRFLAPTGDGQALGWQLPGYAPEGSFGHTGFTGTFVLGVPTRGLSLVLLTNRQNTGVDSETAYVDVGPLQRAVVAALTGGPSPREGAGALTGDGSAR